MERTRVLQIIVCCRLPIYAENLVQSVIKLTNDDILIIDNNSETYEMEKLLERLERNPRIQIIRRKNNDDTKFKVGSLYDAYNEGLEYGIRKNYDWVHLSQQDFQIIQWPTSEVNKLLKAFDSDVFLNLVTTSLAGEGEQTFDKKIGAFPVPGYGATDHGFYRVQTVQKIDFRFRNSEHSNSKYYLNLGYQSYFFPIMLGGAIPWPAVIRFGRKAGNEFSKRYGSSDKRESQIIKINPKYKNDEKVWANYSGNNFILPSNWIALFPYEYTDLLSFSLARSILKNITVNIFRKNLSYMTPEGKLVKVRMFSKIFLSRGRPNVFQIFFHPLIFHISQKIINGFYKIGIRKNDSINSNAQKYQQN
jgi:hypothetical protein